MPKKVGESCKVHKDCINKNCVLGKCTRRKYTKKNNRSKSLKKSKSPPKPKIPSKSKTPSKSKSPLSKLPTPNNNPVKLKYEARSMPSRTSFKYVIEKAKENGFVDGDVFVFEDGTYGVLSGKEIILVGVTSDTYYQFDFNGDSTKYTTNFFKKYKELLKQGPNGGNYTLRHDDEFIKKHFDNINPENEYRVDIDTDEDDESEGNIFIREFSVPDNKDIRYYKQIRRKELTGDLRTILRSV